MNAAGWLARGLAALVIGGALGGCLGHGQATIERIVDGEARRGPWIPPSGYEHFVRAELLVDRGAFVEAIGEYELARSGVVDGYLLAREAEAALSASNPRLAARLVAEGLMSDPTSAPLLLVRARIERERGDVQAALGSLEEARAGAPASVEPVLALASLLTEADRGDEALAALDAFLERHPSNVAALRAELERALVLGDARHATLAVLRLVRAAPEHRAEALAFARRALEGGHAALALAALDAIPIAQDELELRFAVALAAHDRATCERLLERMDDPRPATRLRVAEHWIALADGERAEELASGVLVEERDAPSPRTLRVLGHALLVEGRLDEAAELLSRVPRGTSEGEAARAILAEAIGRAGLPALGAEVAR